MIGKPAAIGFVKHLLRERIAACPGPDRKLDARSTLGRAPPVGERNHVAQALAGIAACAREPARQRKRGTLAPGLQYAAEQIFTITEVPVEAAAGDPELPCEHIDPHVVDALAHQHVGGGIDPDLGGERLPEPARGSACRGGASRSGASRSGASRSGASRSGAVRLGRPGG